MSPDQNFKGDIPTETVIFKCIFYAKQILQGLPNIFKFLAQPKSEEKSKFTDKQLDALESIQIRQISALSPQVSWDFHTNPIYGAGFLRPRT